MQITVAMLAAGTGGHKECRSPHPPGRAHKEVSLKMGSVETDMCKSSGTSSAMGAEEGRALRRRAGSWEKQQCGRLQGVGVMRLPGERGKSRGCRWRRGQHGSSCKRRTRILGFNRCNASVMFNSYLFSQWYVYACVLFWMLEISHHQFKKTHLAPKIRLH